MIFGTYWFVVFCGIFYPGYWILSFSRALRQVWLLAACFIFHYHFAGPAGVLPIIVLSLFTFAVALTRRTPLIVFAIVVNVSALFFYKYFHFLALDVLGIAHPGLGAWVDKSGSVMLPGAPPLAISFFIFELVHYLYDVKCGTTPVRNIAHYASFVFYFPSLVAGPIKRYENFVPELNLGLGSVSRRQVMEGLLRIARGYFLKVALADFITGFISYQEPHFDELSLLMRWCIFLALGLRIWFDFSGYSEIAIGLALMMGIKLPENFNWPYAALNIRDFWHRWHISLSSWIRDYIYIPLGGNRVGLPRKILNGTIAFGLCGLWHGPAWHFILWGLYHGAGLAISSNYPALCGKPGKKLHFFFEANPLVSWALTFSFVMVGWVFFFYPLPHAMHFLYLLLLDQPVSSLGTLALVLLGLFLIGKLHFFWELAPRPNLTWFSRLLPLQPNYLFLGVLLGFGFCCLAGKYPQTHNIYKNIVRYHQGLNPQSAYYPTASQTKAWAEATIPKDKILVVIGGNSVFMGMRQNVSDIWTLELQKLLGDQFAILNVGLPNGSPTGVGAVTFEMLSKEYPKIIFAVNGIPIGGMPLDGGGTYNYFFWDAYYRGLLDFTPDRLELVKAYRREEWKSVDGQELHIRSYVDSFVNANDLWTWFGYGCLWTVWSDKTADTPFLARQYYEDDHDLPYTKPINFCIPPPKDKPANYQFRLRVNITGTSITPNALWDSDMKNQALVVPISQRKQTIMALHWFNPYTCSALTKEEIAAQDFCYNSAEEVYRNAGYTTLQVGKDYSGEEYIAYDGTHLNPEGGRHMARQLAPLILQIAKDQHYIGEDHP
jgi:alginate O-acetyltransferase complex protein AlgI